MLRGMSVTRQFVCILLVGQWMFRAYILNYTSPYEYKSSFRCLADFLISFV